MDATACRERLGALIADATGALDDLAASLDREHELLLANEVSELDGAMRTRQRTVSRVMRIDEERQALCRRVGYPTDLVGLKRLFEWCDPHASLAGAWKRCVAGAAKCRELNDRNGALVSARLKHVQARLGTLMSGRRETVTYGRRGGYAIATVGQVVTTKA
ncbi:MAG TPA: flagellar protein FlgN [Steroidobacteraceae bacterium]|nr:flagellar protein FlgN [Steroidobacteraceae bacterium]